jgi:hypothetical protein
MSTTRRKPRDNGQPGLVALEAASAEILTASVTIKTLRVDSRQLTMGTFRQLPKRTLVDEDKVELLGTVWGHVNYHPDGDHDHRQFVVQFGEKLYRCPTWVRPLRSGGVADWPFPLQTAWDMHRAHCAYAFMEGVIRGEMHLPQASRRDYEAGHEYAHYEVQTRAYPPFPPTSTWFGKQVREWKKTHFSESYLELLRAIEDPRYLGCSDRPATRAQAVDELHELMKRYCIKPDAPGEWWEQLLHDGAASALDYIARWNALMDRLDTVEQLYIAT